MRESNGLPGPVPFRIIPNGTALTASSAVVQSLETIHDFVNNFSQQDIEQHCWELLYAAFNSSYADSWSAGERSAMLYFYRQLSGLAPALNIVDRELRNVLINANAEQQ